MSLLVDLRNLQLMIHLFSRFVLRNQNGLGCLSLSLIVTTQTSRLSVASMGHNAGTLLQTFLSLLLKPGIFSVNKTSESFDG